MEQICISKINLVFYVPTGMYSEPTTVFSSVLPCNELICYLDNTDSTTHIGQYTVHNRPNKIVIYPAGDWKNYSVERCNSGDCIDIYFNTATPLPMEILEFEPKQVAHLTPLFQKAHRLWKKQSPSSYYSVLSLVYEIFAGLEAAQQQAYLPSRKAEQLAPAEAYLEQYLFSPEFSHRSLQASTDLSYTYFYNLFLRKYGVTPEKYVENRRLTYACELLQTNRFSIGEISEAVGYSSVYYFSRVFKKVYGISPSQYQKRAHPD